MAKRGRKSAAEQETAQIIEFEKVRAEMVRPSEQAPPDVRLVFMQLLGSVPDDHFRRQDEFLLELLAQNIVIAKKAYDDIYRRGIYTGDKKTPHPALAIHEKAVKNVATLSTKLRLTPQSRIDPRTAGRNKKPPSSAQRPWDQI